MKRKSVICLLALMTVCTVFAGCGKTKQTTGNIVDNADRVEEVNNAEENSGSDETSVDMTEEGGSDSEHSIELYEAFISENDLVKVHTDINDLKKKNEEYDEFSYFGENEGFTIVEFIKKVIETESAGLDVPMFQSLSYAIIDCGLDGNPELALKVQFNQYRTILTRQYVIKDIDGELQLVYMDYALGDEQETYLHSNGKVVEHVDYFGSDTYSDSYAYLDAECNYNFAYEEMISKTGYVELDDRFDPELIYGEDSYKPAFLKAYAFTERDDDNYSEWRQNRWYCVEKTDADPKMDIDYKKNEEEFGLQFRSIGDRLHNMDEINKKIKQIETDLSLTDELKSDAPIEWIECDVDKALINPVFEYDNEGVADNVFTINPRSLENIKWVDDTHVDITDDATGETYHLSYEKTILDQGIPCADYDEDCISWIKTYLEHNVLTDEDEDSPLFCRGFAPGDIWEIKVDDNNNIWIIYSITYWD